MAMTISNPVPCIGEELQNGLDSIIQSPLATVDNLVDAVYNYLQPIYFPNAIQQVKIELKSVSYNAINSYASNLALYANTTFNAKQQNFVQKLTGGITNGMTPASLGAWIAQQEPCIGLTGISVIDQAPLFIATTIGNNALTYWNAQIANPQSPWRQYIGSGNSVAWTVAAMNGAFCGYGASPCSLIDPTSSVVSNNMMSALIAALTVTAGVVVFGWVPLQ